MLFQADEVLQPSSQLEINLVLRPRLPDFQKRKSSAVEKSCAPWKDRKARSAQPWRPAFCSITSSMALSPGPKSKPGFCGVRKQKKALRGALWPSMRRPVGVARRWFTTAPHFTQSAFELL